MTTARKPDSILSQAAGCLHRCDIYSDTCLIRPQENQLGMRRRGRGGG